MKRSIVWMQYAKAACSCHVDKMCTIRDGDPKLLHKRLWKQARRMGWTGYGFKQDGKGGVVVHYKNENIIES